MNYALMGLFAVLAGLKFIAAMPTTSALSAEAIPPALTYMLMFGSPQLFWLAQCRTRLLGGAQVVIALIVVVAFTVVALEFGFWPGSAPPRWGGEAHFEVPFAFVLEWLIALLAIVPFRGLARRSL
jgi:hypothetical protein